MWARVIDDVHVGRQRDHVEQDVLLRDAEVVDHSGVRHLDPR